MLLTGAAAALTLGGMVRHRFRRAMDAAARAVDGGSVVVTGRLGRIEYAEAGKGPPVLVLHGTGGGFDQGMALARPLVEAGMRVIAPSRFGYLQSEMPADPSSAAQADVLAGLLDTLGVDRVPVIGASAGALPALQFAIRHPDRCRGLVALVPAAYAPDRPPMRPDAMGQLIMSLGLRSDALFWAGLELAEDRMIATILATDPALVSAATASEQARVRAILHGILPVSRRTQGILMDARLAGTPAPMALDRIRAPTLAISLEDDRFDTLPAARHIAQAVSGARLVSYPTGGHVFVGRSAELFVEVRGFLSSLPA